MHNPVEVVQNFTFFHCFLKIITLLQISAQHKYRDIIDILILGVNIESKKRSRKNKLLSIGSETFQKSVACHPCTPFKITCMEKCCVIIILSPHINIQYANYANAYIRGH